MCRRKFTMVACHLLFALLGIASARVFVLDESSTMLNGTIFDYVVVGCGIAGLVVASRLSEDANMTVICIEAGPLDEYEPMIQYPVYIGLQPPLFYEWGMMTTPQTYLDGRPRPAPCGRGVGGGSIINGMLWNRGSQVDFDTWEALGNAGWGWDDMLPYFRKSETFTPQAYAGQNLSDTNQIDSFDPHVHGFTGPTQVSYPDYLWPQSIAWFEALEELGIPKATDPNDGSVAGGYFIPSTIHASNQTRSDARRNYWDPHQNRTNFNLAVNAQVIRILFNTTGPATGPTRRQTLDNTTLRATAVEVAFNPFSALQTIYARREILLAAGGLHTPTILEHSGVGDPTHLSKLNMTPLIPLPGVGNNLQDHALIHLSYPYQLPNLTSPATLLTNATFFAESEEQYLTSKTGPWTAKPSTAVGFPSLTHTTNSTYVADILALASLHNATQHLPPNTPSEVIAGYLTQLPHILTSLSLDTTPAHEILNDNAGALDLALLRPLSRGSVHATAKDPFVHPAINPNYLAHPLDRLILLRAMEFNTRLLHTSALSAFLPLFSQVPENATEAEMSEILDRGVGTEFHFSGTAAMMPREKGGVVDAELRVYGTEGLRVVDASVFPVVPGAHLQAVVYGVAERAADLIKGDGVVRGKELRRVLEEEVPEVKGDFWGWVREEMGLDGKEAGGGRGGEATR